MRISDDRPRSAVRQLTWQHQPRKSWYTRLVGRPLPTADAPHQTISKVVGLAVFASDALSSTAYATQEILIILALAGSGALSLAVPIAIGIAVLLAIVTFSYEQTIHAYPSGGGAYIVARDNLGDRPSQIAGAALLTDYVLTVAVSIASGVAQIVSAAPHLAEYRVPLCLAFILFVMLANLRGVKESGALFALPTYFFVAIMYGLVAWGLGREFGGTLSTVPAPPSMEPEIATHTVSWFLILKAFSSGTAALTGVEAISNGIPAFREPKSHNAGITLIWMSCILGTLFLGLTWLAHFVHAVPSEHETVISQLARTIFGGRNGLYYFAIGSTTLILVLAANTAFADFPRLAALLAADGYLPRQLTFRGSRLVFSRGILALALFAMLLVVVFQGSVTHLIPLYAIGVFMSFTLSQAGMARRWIKIGRLKAGESIAERGSTLHADPGWRWKMVVNGAGAVLTFVVMWVFAITKFTSGAWIVILLLPALVLIFSAIHRHYENLARRLSMEGTGLPARARRQRVIVPISGVHRGTLSALDYARSLSNDVTAVYVSIDDEAADAVRSKWNAWGDGVRLVVIESPYRLLLEPLLAYLEDVAAQRQPNETITVVVPQFVPGKWWHNVLHTQTAMWLRLALIRRAGFVVTDVPYLLEPEAGRGGGSDADSFMRPQ
ncbi:MAG: APC family permease [Fimbriimonadaceae bacterium]|nr:APC family permease [Fimbriimonadaceae bacterium]